MSNPKVQEPSPKIATDHPINEFNSPVQRDPTSSGDVLAQSLGSLSLTSTNHSSTAFLPENTPNHATPVAMVQGRLPPIIYERKQLLYLSKSPLVTAPPNFPPLKDWFGDWTEQHVSKKDSDTNPHPRDRRFKRDSEETEAGVRPLFRSAVGTAQPSQMGNFKHQSLRVSSMTDRIDRERDLPERERDYRDRDGNERLRNLSEKYDRDRLALASSSGLRREKESAAATTSRSVLGTIVKSEKKERDRDPTHHKDRDREGGRRKAESADDWRKGSRDDRPDYIRDRSQDSGRGRSRDELRSERPPHRSGKYRRDSSWDADWDAGEPRRDSFGASPPRSSNGEVNRDRKVAQRGASRERGSRHEGYDAKDDRNMRRSEQDTDGQDPRRWRDDGRWEERKAAREARERLRGRDGESGSVVQGRVGNRSRRNAEDEREPAWMETYDPATDGKLTGILGGNSSDGQLDDIQAWKKELREKELRDQGFFHQEETTPSNSHLPKVSVNTEESSTAPIKAGQLDEISMFKMMMEREQTKVESAPISHGSAVAPSASREDALIGHGMNEQLPFIGGSRSHYSDLVSKNHLPESLLTGSSPIPANENSTSNRSTISIDDLSAGSDSVLAQSRTNATQRQDYQPPQQSRILAFGLPNTPSTSSTTMQPGPNTGPSHQPSPTPPFTAPLNPSFQPQVIRDSEGFSRSEQGVSSFVPQRTSSGLSDRQRIPTRNHTVSGPGDQYKDPMQHDMRVSPSIAGHQSGMNASSDPAPAASGSSSLRGGSRFAKFFDPKTRDSISAQSQSNAPAQRVMLDEFSAFGPNHLASGPVADTAFDSLLTMLHNSSRASQPFLASRSLTMQTHPFHTLEQSVLPSDGLTRALPFGTNNNPNSFTSTIPRSSPVNPQGLQSISRIPSAPMYSSSPSFEPDNRFGPEELLPGLRSLRAREPSGNLGPQIPESLGEQIPYNYVRHGGQQPTFDPTSRTGHPMYRPNSPPSNARNTVYNSNINGQSFANSYGPGSGPLAMQQRLPPGLANLGSRPPHDPGQLSMNVLGGVPSSGMHQPQPSMVPNELLGVPKYAGQQARVGQYSPSQSPFNGAPPPGSGIPGMHNNFHDFAVYGNGNRGPQAIPSVGTNIRSNGQLPPQQNPGMRVQNQVPTYPRYSQPGRGNGPMAVHLQPQLGQYGMDGVSNNDLMALLLSGGQGGTNE